MNLKQALAEPGAPSVTEVARTLGIAVPSVSQWVARKRPIPPRHCMSLIKLLPGLTLYDLRPHDAEMIWPELAASGQTKEAGHA